MAFQEDFEWQSEANPTFKGAKELHDSEIGLIGYTTEIVRKLYFGLGLDAHKFKQSGAVLDFGAGLGFLAEIFRDNFNITPDCVELDPKLLKILKGKGFRSFSSLKEMKNEYLAIYSSNVLEHIEDDVEFLKLMHSSLSRNGLLAIYVPAHPILYSSMDRQIGHVRRYTKSELSTKVTSAGFKVQSISYDDSIGFFASAFVKLIGYRNKIVLGSTSSLVFYDTYIYPISRVIDALGMRHFLGKNLILFASKLS
jgi:SAM-dependent methyltransferase